MNQKDTRKIALKIVQGAIWNEFMNPSSLTTDVVSIENYPEVERELEKIIGMIAREQIAAGEGSESDQQHNEQLLKRLLGDW